MTSPASRTLEWIASVAARPDPKLTVSEWADKLRYLSSRSSAEVGRWKTDRTPYLREIMNSLSPSCPVHEVVFMKAAQVGGTECGSNWLGYMIDKSPGPIMFVSPTVEMAKRTSRQRIDPMIEACPSLRAKVREHRSRDAGNTLLLKEFTGGVLILTGSNSSAGLRSMPVGRAFLDEIDAYPGDVEGEGDPIELAKARMRTFPRWKMLLVSTPTITGRSRIAAAYEESDQRTFHVPCPGCGFFQPLKFGNLRWDEGHPGTVVYGCQNCGTAIPEYEKTRMLAAGKWVAEKPERPIRGYHLNALYSPLGWFSWVQIVEQFRKASHVPDRLRVFVNTVLGETWAEQGDAPEWERIYRRRETYPIGVVPPGGLVLTAGADVQSDRIEVEVVAWGRDLESWSVDYRVLMGSPSEPGVWAKLDELLNHPYEHGAKGTQINIRMLAIDSGYATQNVYAWVRRKSIDRVIAVKGRDNYPTLIGQLQIVDFTSRGKKLRRGARVWPIGVGIAKSELYGRLRLEPPLNPEEPYLPGFCHLPQYGEEYFRQLTAETLRVVTTKQGRRTHWEKTRERNEALDCRVYARAAAAVIGLDRYRDSNWRTIEAALGAAGPKPKPRPEPTVAPAAQAETEAPTHRRKRGPRWIEPRPGGFFGGGSRSWDRW